MIFNKEFRHNRIYYNLQKLYKLYWLQRQYFSKVFKYATGEQLLNELTTCIYFSVQASLYGKCNGSLLRLLDLLLELSARLETIHSLLILVWELKFLSHGALVSLTELIGNISRQVIGWRNWFKGKV